MTVAAHHLFVEVNNLYVIRSDIVVFRALVPL